MLSSSSVDIVNGNGDDISIAEDSNTKKVDKNVGQPAAESFFLSEQDVKKSIVDGVPSIDFSDRVYQILEKEMSTSIILKMLGWNIGISTLQNKLYWIWRPSKPFQLMNNENGYFLAKFQNSVDNDKILSQGSWVIFGHYLTAQLWSIEFNPNLPYRYLVQTWILFPGLPSHLYKRQILMEIGGLIGKVTKLDFNTDSRVRGRYARMAVFVNLGRPLISKILINGNPQRIEYENLPVVCFKCGRYGHTNETCLLSTPSLRVVEKGESSERATISTTAAGEGEYGPWMLVEQKSRRGNLEGRKAVGNWFSKANLSWRVGQGQMGHESSSLKQADHVIAKRSGSKGGWKLNKTVKDSSHATSFPCKGGHAGNRASNLITSEIEEHSAKDLSRHLEEEADISSFDRQ
ncbi:hypothetical protein Goklo_025405 [Gossypium klotzschianum]|uniref:CCHC-type domain-containing protein n=1 Tax=Gossypium klotzschianum TaxID=34286 RepID=A0A7J8W6W3_9ROSI|nr:hypothetical protein [Gossypium klotzschianum]